MPALISIFWKIHKFTRVVSDVVTSSYYTLSVLSLLLRNSMHLERLLRGNRGFSSVLNWNNMSVSDATTACRDIALQTQGDMNDAHLKAVCSILKLHNYLSCALLRILVCSEELKSSGRQIWNRQRWKTLQKDKKKKKKWLCLSLLSRLKNQCNKITCKVCCLESTN